MIPMPDWVRDQFRTAILLAMVGCLAISLVQVVHIFAPNWNGTYVIVAMVLATWEALYSRRVVEKRQIADVDLIRFRIAEYLLLFIAIKFARYLGWTFGEVWEEIRLWPSQPLEILDLETLGVYIACVLMRWQANQIMNDLDTINEPNEAEYRTDDTQASARERIVKVYLWGGVVMTLIAGFNRIGPSIMYLLTQDRPAVSGMVPNIVVYFLLGLLLIGQIQFISLNKEWRRQNAPVDKRIPKRWVQYSLVFVVVAALIAVVLPTRYTVGLLNLIASIAMAIAGGVLYIMQHLFVGFAFVLQFLGYLVSLLMGEPGEMPYFEAPESGGNAIPGTLSGLDWLSILRSVGFWTVILGMTYYLVRSYLREHPAILEALKAFEPLQKIRQFWLQVWRSLFGWGKRTGQRIQKTIQERIQSFRNRRRQPGSMWRPRMNTLRQRIRYYYLSILERAAQQGIARRPSQTPYEYDETIEPYIPQAETDMDELTQAFIEARYSHHDLNKQQETNLRQQWQEIKAALRRRRRER